MQSPSTPDRVAGRSFIRRVWLTRALGLGVGSVAVAGVWWGRDTPIGLWALLAVYCYLWPLLAYRIALHAAKPFAVERRHVLFDSFMGGFLIAAIDFNLLPAVMLLSMLAMNNTAAGGARLVLPGLLCQLLGMGLFGVLLGLRFDPQITQQIVYASLPMLVIHPMTVGLVLYRLAMQLGEHKKALRALSRTDALTGLLNRGYWSECLEWSFQLSRRDGPPACLVLIDVDHFKTANDNHGHLLGDEVLRQLAHTLRAGLRAADLVGRYGGDEFCILLPQTTPEQASKVLERLGRAVSTRRFAEAPQLRISLSIGVAGFSAVLDDSTAWLKVADQALYEAKRRGRDCIVLIAEDGSFAPPVEAVVPA
ncbi:MAG: diguanylate cyclase [Pseudomonadota bacterium]